MVVEIFNPYFWAVKLRNYLYDRGLKKICSFDVPIISIGNLSVGGTGKTPTTLELAKFLNEKGFNVSILLRGYRRRKKGTLLVSNGKEIFYNPLEVGDEAYLYAKLLKIPVAVAKKRCKGAKLLIEKVKPDLILLDDAFQHRAIGRDLDIVLITPKDFKSKLLPFGRLREPLESLKRADYCLISKTESFKPLEVYCKRLGKPFGYLKLKGFKLYSNRLEELSFKNLKGLKVGVVSALGDNKTFQKQVFELSKQHGFEVVKKLSFRDHFDYRGVELDKNLLWITTFKDFFKLQRFENILVLDRVLELPKSLKRIVMLNLYVENFRFK